MILGPRECTAGELAALVVARALQLALCLAHLCATPFDLGGRRLGSGTRATLGFVVAREERLERLDAPTQLAHYLVELLQAPLAHRELVVERGKPAQIVDRTPVHRGILAGRTC